MTYAVPSGARTTGMTRANNKPTANSAMGRLLFFSICSLRDRKKLIGEEIMSIRDFERISYLLDALGFYEYKIAFDMEHKDLLEELAWNIKQEVNRQSIKDEYLLQDKLDVAEYWQENFMNTLPDGAMREYIQEIFDLCE